MTDDMTDPRGDAIASLMQGHLGDAYYVEAIAHPFGLCQFVVAHGGAFVRTFDITTAKLPTDRGEQSALARVMVELLMPPLPRSGLEAAIDRACGVPVGRWGRT